MLAGFLFGWAVSGRRGDGAFIRAVVTMGLWVAAPLLAARLFAANVAPGQDGLAGGLTAAGLLAFALHRPYSNRVKLRLVEGLLLWCRFLLVLGVVVLVGKLCLAGFSLKTIQGAGRWLATAVAAFVAGSAIEWWLARCRRLLADADP